MSTSSTASNYYTKIDQNFPVAGQNNDTQIFRDNYKNIVKSLEFIDIEVTDIKLNAVRSNQTNNFNNNIIKQAALQDCSYISFDDTSSVQTGNVDIDFSKGTVQVFKISNGSHRFSVINQPPAGKALEMTLIVSSTSTAATYIEFGAIGEVVNLSNKLFPSQLQGTSTHVFKLLTDGISSNLYVNELTNQNVLPSYTSAQLGQLTNVLNGTMVFLTSEQNKPVYYYNGTWYSTTNNAII
jgi:hypothetical protein